MLILAGDIGGTNTRLVYAEVDTNGWHVLAKTNYFSADYDGLITIIKTFLSEHKIMPPIYAACFAVAGPVEAGVATVTNLPWRPSETELGDMLHTPRVKLINDFVAVAFGIAELADTDVLVLKESHADTGKVISPDAAVLGAGTGLGVSHLIWQKDHFQPYSSEAGHIGFAPENELQCKLLSWLQKQHSHVSLEMVLSGKGLGRIYHFLHEVTGLPESQIIKQAMQKDDPARVITENALSNNDELCQKTLECFVDIYGAAAGDIALHYYPIGELYIAGGIAAKIAEKMLDGRFINAFMNKGPISVILENITIKLIVQEKVGLYGAISIARTL